MRLRLRRGTVVAEQPLTVEVGGERRPAWADTGLLGEMREGDEVVVNVAAVELGLGSGGFDVVHVNLTRGLEAAAPGGRGGDAGGSGESGGSGDASRGGEQPHVMKLNYSSIQHPVDPVEGDPDPARRETRAVGAEAGASEGVRVLVLPLHGHLAPAAWALGQAPAAWALGKAMGEKGAEERGPAAVGYVQTGGGALPGSMSRDVAELRERGLLAGHVTAAPAYGGEHEAISVAGALEAARRLGWDAALVGPGPGIVGSDSTLGHGGMAALDSAHAALALGLPTMLSPRLSSADPRERHRGVSHHTRTVLELLLAPVEVAFPESEEGIATALGEAKGGHRLQPAPADLDGYAASGLPRRTMGRELEEDQLFFAAPLAAGAALRDAAGGSLRRKG